MPSTPLAIARSALHGPSLLSRDSRLTFVRADLCPSASLRPFIPSHPRAREGPGPGCDDTVKNPASTPRSPSNHFPA